MNISAYGGYGSLMNVGSYGAGLTNAGSAGMSAPIGDSGHISEAQEKALKCSGRMECETCAERKYQDGSNENDVSFKAPGHISPQASAATVSAHERQHVANAYESAGKDNGKVIQASVTLKTATCPECGRSYVAGGVTNTMIKYNKDNYSQNAKSLDAASGAVGGNVDYAV